MARVKQYNSADRRERKILLGFVIVAAALLFLWVVLTIVKYGFGGAKVQERTNPEQVGTPRVYDYADMLTDDQEASLEKAIAEAEQAIAADIVIVTENRSFEELYGVRYDSEDEDSAYDCIRRYAESFWDENGFGWNAPGDTGNGIILVDNLYRESNGYVYTWTAGSGDMRYKIGNNSCEKLSNDFIDRLPSTRGMDDLALQYTDVYYDALLGFVSDCSDFGSFIRGTAGWSAFTPSGIARTVGSSFIYVSILVVMLVILFLARRAAIAAADPDMGGFGIFPKGGLKGSDKGGGDLAKILPVVVIIAGVVMSAAMGMTWLAIVAVIASGVLSTAMRKGKGKGTAEMKEGKKAQGPEKANKHGFSMKESLTPKEFNFTQKSDEFVKTYTTSVTHSSGSKGGGGGGGHSGGGGHR